MVFHLKLVILTNRCLPKIWTQVSFFGKLGMCFVIFEKYNCPVHWYLYQQITFFVNFLDAPENDAVMCCSLFQDDYKFEYTQCDSTSQRWRVSVPKNDVCTPEGERVPIRGTACSKLIVCFIPVLHHSLLECCLTEILCCRYFHLVTLNWHWADQF